MLALLTASTALTLDNKHAAAPALRLRGGPQMASSNHPSNLHSSRVCMPNAAACRAHNSHKKVTGVTFAAGLKADGLPLSTGVSFDTSTLNLAAAVYHASFGAGLYADPNCFAESGASPLKYTADTEGPVGSFLGRSFGAMMLGMGSIALFDKESEGVTKMFAVIMSLFCPIMAANTKEDSAGAGHTQMWKLQVINVGNVFESASHQWMHLDLAIRGSREDIIGLHGEV